MRLIGTRNGTTEHMFANFGTAGTSEGAPHDRLTVFARGNEIGFEFSPEEIERLREYLYTKFPITYPEPPIDVPEDEDPGSID